MEKHFEQLQQHEEEETAAPLSVDYIRHSEAEYKTYTKALMESPAIPFDKNKQVVPDLAESGVELAQESAQKYFEKLDPQKTTLFFVSSNEARAIETANIYKTVAKIKGFNVLTPEHSRSQVSDEIAGGEIRILNTLSLNYPNILAHIAFNPAAYRTGINFDNVPTDEKERFEMATAIIDNDDQGSYSKNYEKHSDRIKSIYPEIKSSHDLYETEFSNMKHLLRFANKKTPANSSGQDIKILAFGHEDMLAEALKIKFNEDGIDNCEVLNINFGEGGAIKGTFRGKHSVL